MKLIKKKDKGFMKTFFLRNHLALLLKYQTQQVNFETSQPDSFPNSGLKLTRMDDLVDSIGLKTT